MTSCGTMTTTKIKKTINPCSGGSCMSPSYTTTCNLDTKKTTGNYCQTTVSFISQASMPSPPILVYSHLSFYHTLAHLPFFHISLNRQQNLKIPCCRLIPLSSRKNHMLTLSNSRYDDQMALSFPISPSSSSTARATHCSPWISRIQSTLSLMSLRATSSLALDKYRS